MLDPFLKAATLLFVLLNPFLMVVYLRDLLDELSHLDFAKVLLRGTLIAGAVFIAFAATGDAFFRNVLQVRFASFLVFGGVLFLVIGIRFVLSGTEAVTQLRGPPEHIAGAIAMPFMVGPGTVSASILAGAQLPLPVAVLAITTGLGAAVTCVLVLKVLYARLASTRRELTSRYVDITGRLSALVIGTISVDMIFRGVEMWLKGTR